MCEHVNRDRAGGMVNIQNNITLKSITHGTECCTNGEYQRLSNLQFLKQLISIIAVKDGHVEHLNTLFSGPPFTAVIISKTAKLLNLH